MKVKYWIHFVVLTIVALVLPSTTLLSQAKTGFVNNLMPQPASITVGEDSLVLTPQFSVNTTLFHDARLEDAIRQAMRKLRQKTGIPMSDQTAKTGQSTQLTIAVAGAGERVQSFDEDESYTLVVTPAGARIDAPTVVGAMRGLQTLVQLVQPSGKEYVVPAVSIHDAPRFGWRGLMIDCGRHFEPINVLKRNLDAMAAVKLNVFHWHLTDDQGFRIESKLYPKLTAMGSDGLYYTQNDAAEIIQYARARGIRVVPEFEMPGHSTAWLVAYPELASVRAPNSIRREFGISDYALDPTREITYKFIDRFLGEMAALFPDPYVHIGGDETQSPDWKTDAKIQTFMHAHQLKDSDALQAYFNQRILKILKGHGKHMVGWDEVLNPALPKDVVIQSWRGQASLIQGANQGFNGILSAPYYLDAMKSAAVHYVADPLPASANPTPEQKKLVLGGEVCMWAEQLDERTIDSRIWPKTAAIAERFWSPERVNDVDDMYRRLDSVSVHLEALGLHHLSQEESGLRELAGAVDIDSLRVFASVLEPVSFGQRYDEQQTSQLTVLDSFVDAVRPDPPSRYEINRLTRNFLKNPGADTLDKNALNHWFETMASCAPAVEQQIDHSPLLVPVLSRAQQLPDLAKTGLEAVSFVSSNNKAPQDWKHTKLAQIEAAKKPAGIVRFTFLDALSSLVSAVQD